MATTPSIVSSIRTSIATAIADVTNGRDPSDPLYLKVNAARVYKGWHTRAMSTTSIFADVKANGPLALIGPLRSLVRDNLGYGPAHISCRIFVYKNKSASWTGEELDDLLDAILVRLNTSSYYTACPYPSRVSLDNNEYIIEGNDGMYMMEFSAEVPDPVEGPDA